MALHLERGWPQGPSCGVAIIGYSICVSALVYLDNNATTQPEQGVLEAHAQAALAYWGNTSSPHRFGLETKQVFKQAKHDIAEHLGCRASELVLTSGATEANNLAITGVYEAEQFRRLPRKRMLISSIEHPSVLEVAESLETCGAIVDHIAVDGTGLIDLADLRSMLSEDVLLVSVMAANNEVGTLQPIKEIADACKSVGALFHTDATQWLGRIPLNVSDWGVDLLSASAHKLHGPKGVGLLYVRTGVPIFEQQHGGGHQGGKRSGTIDVPGAVAFAKALDLSVKRSNWDQVIALRERLFEGLSKKANPVQRISPRNGCLPNTLNVRFNGVDSEALMASAPFIYCSPGSACSHASPQPSHVLLAMGQGRLAAGECLRFSLSQRTTAEEIDQAVAVLSEAVHYIRSALAEVA